MLVLLGPGWVYYCESGSQSLDTWAGSRELGRQDPDLAKFRKKIGASGLLPGGLSWAGSSADTALPGLSSELESHSTPLETSPSPVYPLGYRDFLSAAAVRDRQRTP